MPRVPVETTLTSDTEATVEKTFKTPSRLPSNAAAPAQSKRVDQLIIPDEMRAKMPLTKDKYLVRENEHVVAWERETRKFLKKLSRDHEHRVSASMIYEWATGKNVVELIANGENPRPDLMKINKALKFYFGDSYATWIAGRKVTNCYRVRPYFQVTRRRPMTVTLFAEWLDGTLVA